ncbi:hypothetical protein, partial [Streptomyces sp. SID8380]|uniref:hypothetical protein n=1 Tax=Streptomyces sp. SID8380 TaxID=2690360 RepID=UPI001F30A580
MAGAWVHGRARVCDRARVPGRAGCRAWVGERRLVPYGRGGLLGKRRGLLEGGRGLLAYVLPRGGPLYVLPRRGLVGGRL